MIAREDHPADWYLDYSFRDREVVDYQSYELACTPGIRFRGPPVPEDALAAGEFFTCIGAAQTMGIYVQRPYPELLAEQLGLPALNLGLGGAGPGFFLLHDELLKLVNKGRFLILQVMTARSEANSRLEPVGFIETVRDRRTGAVDTSLRTWLRLLEEDRAAVPALVAENLQSWRERYRELLSRIEVPVLLFYFSPKPQDEPVNYAATTIHELMGRFPQFVDKASVNAVRELCDDYCECYSDRNTNHLLLSRTTGEPVVIDHGDLHETMRGHLERRNAYYPSPEMHEDAANVLVDAVRRLEVRA